MSTNVEPYRPHGLLPATVAGHARHLIPASRPGTAASSPGPGWMTDGRIMGGPDRGVRLSVMGEAGRDSHAGLMGESHHGANIDVMGGPDRGPRLHTMGRADPELFVDFVLTGHESNGR